MKAIFRIVAIFFLLFSAFSLKATDYPLRHFTVADGLPSNEVYHVLQDSKGFIWFSTDNGVARYDGIDFEVFTVNDGLTDNTVFEAFEDARGRIWFVGMSGMLSYFYENTIFQYEYNNLLKDLPTNEMIIEKSTFYVDSLGTVSFLSRSRGLKVISPDGQFNLIDSCDFPSRPAWYFVDFSWRPVVPVYSNHHVDNIDFYSDDSLRSYFTIPTNILLSPPSSRQWNDKYILHGGKCLCITRSDHLISKRLFDEPIVYFSEPISNMVWIGLQNHGAQLLELPSLEIIDEVNALENETVTSVMTDRDGGVWFSTLLSGVYYLNPPNSRISLFTDDVLHQSIKTLDYGFDSSIFIGYWKPDFSIINNNGIEHFTPRIGTIDNLLRFFWYPGSPWTYVSGTTKTYKISNDGNVFSKHINYEHLRQYLYLPGDNYFYAASVLGVVRLDDNESIRYALKSDAARIRFESLAYDSINNTIWLGALKGLYSFPLDTKIYEEFYSPETNYRISDLAYFNNQLWIGTNGNGLVVKKDSLVERFDLCSRDNDNSISSMRIIDDDLWVNGGQDLFRISVDSSSEYHINRYSFSRNQIGGNINDFLKYQNKILLGTANGLYEFQPELNNHKTSDAPVYITGLSINLKDTLVKNNYRLSHFQNNIRLSFVALSYADPRRKVFQYRLKGLNDGWINTLNDEVSFHNLPPGEYTFQVKYMASFCASSEPVDLSFVILPPFWKTWWFITLMILLPFSIIGLMFSMKFRRIRSENQSREDLLEARQKALMNQINPHFIFNSLNSIQLFILNNDSKSSSIYLSKFARLIRTSLEISQQNLISLSKELEVVGLYLEMEKLRFRDRLNYEIINELPENPVALQTPPFLIQPLLENALWHGLMAKKGSDGKVILRLTKVDETIVITVTDNGIGRAEARKIRERKNHSHKPLGLSVSRRRLMLLSEQFGAEFLLSFKDLYNEKEEAAGTEVTLVIPWFSEKNKLLSK